MSDKTAQQLGATKLYMIGLGVVGLLFIAVIANQFVPPGGLPKPVTPQKPAIPGLTSNPDLLNPGKNILTKAKNAVEKTVDVADRAADAGGKVIDVGSKTIDRFVKDGNAASSAKSTGVHNSN